CFSGGVRVVAMGQAMTNCRSLRESSQTSSVFGAWGGECGLRSRHALACGLLTRRRAPASTANVRAADAIHSRAEIPDCRRILPSEMHLAPSHKYSSTYQLAPDTVTAT